MQRRGALVHLGVDGRLRSRGNLVGVYGNGAALSSFATIANVPDAAWPARWIYTYYNSSATVWDVPNLLNTLWVNHQRIRQYTGGHPEYVGQCHPEHRLQRDRRHRGEHPAA